MEVFHHFYCLLIGFPRRRILTIIPRDMFISYHGTREECRSPAKPTNGKPKNVRMFNFRYNLTSRRTCGVTKNKSPSCLIRFDVNEHHLY